MATALLSHPACMAHIADLEHASHPDRPERLSGIRDRLISEQLMDFVLEYEAPAATREELERVHDAEHLADLLSREESTGIRRLDADTIMDDATVEAALRAAGAVVKSTDLVMAGEVSNAFCNVRPPGHHATRDAAMGFCFLNNVAVGVAHALAVHPLERIAVIDFDAHHGNGTEAIFQNDSRVMTYSVYERDLYPDSLASTGGPGAVNVVLNPGDGGKPMREAVLQTWEPALAKFRPEMIYVSAGFDGHVDDGISDLRFSDDDYRWLSDFVFEAAETFAEGRLVSSLEGGYDLASLGRCGALHVRTLLGV